MAAVTGTTRFVLAALVLALGLAAPRNASAHAALLATSPNSGARLARAPERVSLRFSEPLEPSLCSIALVSLDGTTRKLAVRVDAHDVRTLVAALPPLADGGYRVQWSIVSADGHPVSGSFAFFVGAEALQAPPPPEQRTLAQPLPGPATVLLRALALGSLMAFAGLLFVRLILHSRNPSGAPALLLAVAAAALLVIYELMVVRYAAGRLDTGAIADELATTQGRIEAARLLLTLLALWWLALVRRPLPAAVCALAAVLITGAVGHAAVAQPLLSIPLRALHVAASALWLGGLLYLVVERDVVLASVLRVSNIALAAVLIIALTGVLQTAIVLHSFAELLTSAYGQRVLIKTAGLATLVVLGARNRYRLIPAMQRGSDDARLRRAVKWEIGVFAIVIAIAGLLSFTPVPAGDVQAVSTHPSQTGS